MEKRNKEGRFLKGHIPWSKLYKGKYHLWKDKIGGFQKGHKIRLGKHHSEEIKKKISLSRVGKDLGNKHGFKKGHLFGKRFKKRNLPWNKGKKIIEISGLRHWNWKGGITKLQFQIRNSFKYRQWRSDVFTRDDFICQNCGIRGGKIIADHIKAFSLILEENNIETFEEAMNCDELWNINNGRTLCEECHKKTENFGGKNNKKVCDR